jgi:hypothetical protein
VGVRAYIRGKRRRANVSIVRWLAEKRLRRCMILYGSAPQALVLILLLTAFLPSSIRSATAGMHDGPMPRLSHVNFYLWFVAKGIVIVAASLVLLERVLKTTRSSDRLIRKTEMRVERSRRVGGE